MCGLFGVVRGSKVGDISSNKLHESVNLLNHRGPDAFGVQVCGNIGLAHTRLALVDLNPRSNQPFTRDANSYYLVYNGEIYNYQELREGLEKKGVHFETSSDTEVLYQLLVHEGIESLGRLEGMFAFAFVDLKRNKVILARDRFGIKPLYYKYSEENRELLFASEINAFSPWLELKPDYVTLAGYVQEAFSPTNASTLFQGIRSVSAGRVMIFENGFLADDKSFYSIADFWNPTYGEELAAISENDIVDLVEEKLRVSIKKHLLADAPVGALCSGGIDSSLILALAKDYHSDLKIFHSNVVGPLSELSIAKSLSKHLGIDMEVIDTEDEDFLADMVKVIKHYGQPFLYHPNSIPLMRVAGLVRDSGVKAILTGEAADECFLGYPQIPLERFFGGYGRGLAGLGNKVKQIPYFGSKLWPLETRRNSISKKIGSRLEREVDRQAIEEKAGVDYEHATVKSIKYLGYHLRTLLQRNDAMGMASSVEARFPYLDHDLVRVGVNLPYKYKIRISGLGGFQLKHPLFTTKWALRKVASRYLPKEFFALKKKGFPTNAYERMAINASFLERSFISDCFGLSKRDTTLLAQGLGDVEKEKLLHLECWGRLFIWGNKETEISGYIKKVAFIR
jgi:asparagine synthase (glutamine-hydrolysing)